MKKGWEYKTLGEIATFSRGLTYKKGDEVSMSKNVVLRSNNIDLMSGQLDLSELKYLNEDFNIPKDKKVIKDSLLICMSNGSKNHLGKVALIDVDYGYAFGGFMGLIVPVQCIKGKYLHIVMSSPKYKEYIKTLSAGANINNLKFADLSKFVIPVPPLSEQEEIVSRLDKAFEQIETLRRNAEQSLTTAQQLFQSTLSYLLTPQPHWERKTLGEISKDMYRGAGIKRDEITNNGTPCLRYGEIYTTYNYSFDKCISHTDINKIKSQKYFEHGDLLFAITGESVEDIGKTIAYTGHEKCLLGGDIVCMKHSQNPQYLAYALSTADAIRQKGKGKVKLKVVHTSIPAIKEIEIPIPPLSEQTAIVAKLDSLSAKVKQLKDNHTRTVALCDEMKQALLKEVFE